MVLKDAQLEGDTLSFKIRILEGKMPKAGGINSLFIDIIGLVSSDDGQGPVGWILGETILSITPPVDKLLYGNMTSNSIRAVGKVDCVWAHAMQ